MRLSDVCCGSLNKVTRHAGEIVNATRANRCRPLRKFQQRAEMFRLFQKRYQPSNISSPRSRTATDFHLVAIFIRVAAQ